MGADTGGTEDVADTGCLVFVVGFLLGLLGLFLFFCFSFCFFFFSSILILHLLASRVGLCGLPLMASFSPGHRTADSRRGPARYWASCGAGEECEEECLAAEFFRCWAAEEGEEYEEGEDCCFPASWARAEASWEGEPPWPRLM